MRHKIQARAIVYDPSKEAVLLVKKAGAKFWHLPGGGQENGETNTECAVRETLEETGLQVVVDRLLYVQELHDTDRIIVEIFWLGHLSHPQELKTNHTDLAAEDDGIEEVAWFTREAISRATVYPEVMQDKFWNEIKDEFSNESVFIGVVD